MEDIAKRLLSSSRQYTVAWLAALPSERAAAEILLDEEHEKPTGFIKNAADTNSYTWGRMGKHNVVIASLPSGEYGTVVTADMASGLRASLPHIRVGLLVGIAAGVTGEREEPAGKFSIDRDIRLGDVAVSNPDKVNGGIVQYDLYKAKVRKINNSDGSTSDESYGEAKGFVNAPPRALRSALSALQAKHEYDESRVAHHLQRFKKNKKTRTFAYPGILVPDDEIDGDGSESGDSDDEDPLRVAISEKRVTLRSGMKFKKLKHRTEPAIHYGTIASGDTLLKDKLERDGIILRLKANNVEPVCFEMEAAGIMGSFPSLVIRGICDYGDDKKNDAWQKYAAATAAAFAKEFLEYLDVEEVEQEAPIRHVAQMVEQLTEQVGKHVVDYRQQQMNVWLSPPDPSTNLNRARALRHPETGRWFLQSEQYKYWRENLGSSLWLHGFAGCGKTVLSSTIIKDLQENSSDNIVLCFFFDFNDSDKQSFGKMLRSLISQIYHHCKTSQKHLNSMYSACADGGTQPDTLSLITGFQSMVAESGKLHVVLDALDECDMETRAELLSWLHSVSRGNLHLAVTSRQEQEIEISLTKWIPAEALIPIQNKMVDEDIRAVIRNRLEVDEDLKRWQSRKDVCDEIETKLMERADGMFRWAACQLDALRKCLNLPDLRRELSSLPRDLDGTYSRILKNIRREGHERNAIRLLQFLTYSWRPLLLEEAVDAIAVDPDIDNCEDGFDKQNRMPNPNEIVRYCSSLVRLTSRVANSSDLNIYGDEYKEGTTITELQLAHFSVKEYLMSTRIEEPFKEFLTEACSRAAIVEVSISYMLAASRNHNKVRANTGDLPLVFFSRHLWIGHARDIDTCQGNVAAWIDKLFTTEDAYRYWLELYHSDGMCNQSLPDPLYYASESGLTTIARRMIDQGSDVNAKGKYSDNALSTALRNGHQAVAQLLVDRGADVNSEDRFYGYVLQAASDLGFLAIVQLLLNRGAEVNANGGEFGFALHAASRNGHQAVVQLLLDKGANINANGGEYGFALHAASSEGHQAVVQLLLDRGADINARGGEYSSALCGAFSGGHENVAMLLLGRGAHTVGVEGQVIYCASKRGNERVVQELIDLGTDVNSKCDRYPGGSALSVASEYGHEMVVQMLLDAGAEVNTKDSHGFTALHEASKPNYEGRQLAGVVQILLDAGAEVNAEDCKGRSALQLACSGSREKVVQVLLDAGAEVNLGDEEGCNALHQACATGYEEVVQMLLVVGAEINAEDHKGRNALELASYYGYEKVVQVLVDAGADFNAGDNKYLKVACRRGYEKVVKVLLAAGADVNAEDNESLKLAAMYGDEKVVQTLLAAGADVNAGDNEGLKMACLLGHEKAVQVLLAAGSDVHAGGNESLKLASECGHEKVVQILLDAGANFNARGNESLELATQGGHENVVQILLDAGANSLPQE